MYLFFFFPLLFLLLFLSNCRRKKRIIKKINDMPTEEKCRLLNELAEPLGYAYQPEQDLFSTTRDAWQKRFGYTALYDRAAPRFNMVFDCEPVYFDYLGETWLIEFWKGQYGINTGAEIGVYHAGRILTKAERKTALFTAADESKFLPLSFSLSDRGKPIAVMSEKHWWLTAFCMGHFAEPSSLSMKLCITFPDASMAEAFLTALLANNPSRQDICSCGCKLCFSFTAPPKAPWGNHLHLLRRFAQWKNKRFCNLFLFVTRPFRLSLDRLLYLYFYLPFAFHRTLRLRRYRRKH